jgi:hypothetical protein
MTVPPFTHTWIEPGKMMIGSIPSTPDDIETLVVLGVKSILTLTRRAIDTYPGVMDSLNKHSMFWRHFPIPDGGIPDDGYRQARHELWWLDETYQHFPAVYVHCRGGIGRSGIILQAYYCLYHGKTIDEARDMLRIRRNYEGNATAADQGSPQREWLEGLVKIGKKVIE